MAAHLIPFLGLELLGPLIIWLIKRDEDPFVELHSREALNFQISVLIYAIIVFILVFALVGLLLIPVLILYALVFAIVAAVMAANGEEYRYPLTIRLVRP